MEKSLTGKSRGFRDKYSVESFSSSIYFIHVLMFTTDSTKNSVMKKSPKFSRGANSSEIVRDERNEVSLKR